MVFNKTIRWFIAILYLVIITILFFLPGSAFPKESWFSKISLDKWIHVIMFAILAGLWVWAMNIDTGKKAVGLLVGLTFYGFVIEATQGLYVINRSFDNFDLLANFLGAAAGIYFSGRYIKK